MRPGDFPLRGFRHLNSLKRLTLAVILTLSGVVATSKDVRAASSGQAACFDAVSRLAREEHRFYFIQFASYYDAISSFQLCRTNDWIAAASQRRSRYNNPDDANYYEGDNWLLYSDENPRNFLNSQCDQLANFRAQYSQRTEATYLFAGRVPRFLEIPAFWTACGERPYSKNWRYVGEVLKSEWWNPYEYGQFHETVNISICVAQPVTVFLSVNGKRAPGATWKLTPDSCDSESTYSSSPIYINPLFLYTLKKSDLNRVIAPEMVTAAVAKTSSRKFLLQLTYKTGSFSRTGYRVNYFFNKSKQGLDLGSVCLYADVELGYCAQS